MYTLEYILSERSIPKRLRKVEQFLLETFSLESRLAELGIAKVAVHNSPSELGAYTASNDPAHDDTYILNSYAVNDIRVLLHEAGHRIRQKLNLAAKQYMLEPANRVGVKLNEFYERINLEEMFAKFCEKVGLNLLGIQTYTYKIGNYFSQMNQKIKNSPKELYDWIIHAFGYQKAEEMYVNSSIIKLKELGKRLLYSNNPTEFGISVPICSVA